MLTLTKTVLTTTFRSKVKKRTKGQTGVILGFRSGLERSTADYLTARGIPFAYEDEAIHYVKPAKKARYTRDFLLLNSGIIIETKGRFMPEDRQKHLLIKDQHPELDIRFVFSRSKTPIQKGSKTTYASWCEKNGFLYADKVIPEAWLKETQARPRE